MQEGPRWRRLRRRWCTRGPGPPAPAPRGPRPDAPASCQEEAPRSPDGRGRPEEGAAPAAAVPRGQQPPQARGPRALLRGPHPGGEWEGGHPDADHLAHHPRSRRRVGREQPGRSAAPSAPSPGSEPGTRGETLPLPSAWACDAGHRRATSQPPDGLCLEG
uniref:CCDC71LY n=1 Tax=Felis catus TaxID=9685 RepID=A0A3G7HQ75_FELCA|nr:CCDC71LY [Felis catus]